MLTGRSRYRRSFFGKIIVQVEDEVPNIYNYDSPYDLPPSSWKDTKLVWRDATFNDIVNSRFSVIMTTLNPEL